jgi:hypothetical protein
MSAVNALKYKFYQNQIFNETNLINRPQALCCTGAGWPATDGPDTIDFSFAFSLTCSAMPGNLEK